jgi:pimeloyl-ACP methyl ester carboxylesterase
MTSKTFNDFNYATDDGLTLHGRDYGIGTEGRSTIVCLSGLTRNARDFHRLAVRLADDGWRVIALDYRGRGLSAWDPNPANYNVLREAQDVLLALADRGLRDAVFFGTSRGGLILHILAVTAPQAIRALVFNDIGPVIETEGLKAIAHYLSVPQRYEDQGQAIRALKTLHQAQFPALGDDDWADMVAAVYRESDGVLVPDYDPALLDGLKSIDRSRPLVCMVSCRCGRGARAHCVSISSAIRSRRRLRRMSLRRLRTRMGSMARARAQTPKLPQT